MKPLSLFLIILLNFSSTVLAEDFSTIKNAYLLLKETVKRPDHLGTEPQDHGGWITESGFRGWEPEQPDDVQCRFIWHPDFKKKLPKGSELKIKELKTNSAKDVIHIKFEDASIFKEFWCEDRDRRDFTFELLKTKLSGAFELKKK